jgi:S1-C subfamily serine protease
VDGGYDPHVWFAESGDVFRRNIMWTVDRLANMRCPPWGAEMDFNLVQDFAATASTPAARLQQQSGRDTYSIVAEAQFINAARGNYQVKDGSPAMALGFVNFPMDRFGVQKPELKSIARLPQLPHPKMPVPASSRRDTATVTWLGLKVRNITDEGEMSAFGLAGVTGVLLLEIPSEAALAKSGLQKDDVILFANSEKISDTAALLRVTPALPAGTPLKVRIYRNQTEVLLQLNP